MNSRQLSRQLYPPPPRELDYDALEAFQADTINELKMLRQTQMDAFANIASQIANLERVIHWIKEHRPQAIEDYKTTHAVINRLEDSNDEMMEKEA